MNKSQGKVPKSRLRLTLTSPSHVSEWLALKNPDKKPASIAKHIDDIMAALNSVDRLGEFYKSDVQNCTYISLHHSEHVLKVLKTPDDFINLAKNYPDLAEYLLSNPHYKIAIRKVFYVVRNIVRLAEVNAKLAEKLFTPTGSSVPSFDYQATEFDSEKLQFITLSDYTDLLISSQPISIFKDMDFVNPLTEMSKKTTPEEFHEIAKKLTKCITEFKTLFGSNIFYKHCACKEQFRAKFADIYTANPVLGRAVLSNQKFRDLYIKDINTLPQFLAIAKQDINLAVALAGVTTAEGSKPIAKLFVNLLDFISLLETHPTVALALHQDAHIKDLYDNVSREKLWVRSVSMMASNPAVRPVVQDIVRVARRKYGFHIASLQGIFDDRYDLVDRSIQYAAIVLEDQKEVDFSKMDVKFENFQRFCQRIDNEPALIKFCVDLLKARSNLLNALVPTLDEFLKLNPVFAEAVAEAFPDKIVSHLCSSADALNKLSKSKTGALRILALKQPEKSFSLAKTEQDLLWLVRIVAGVPGNTSIPHYFSSPACTLPLVLCSFKTSGDTIVTMSQVSGSLVSQLVTAQPQRMADALQVIDAFLKLPAQLMTMYLDKVPHKIAEFFENAIFEDLNKFMSSEIAIDNKKSFIRKKVSVFANVFLIGTLAEQIDFVNKYPVVAELLLAQAHKIAPTFTSDKFKQLAEQSPRFAWLLLKRLHQQEPSMASTLISSADLLLELADKMPMFVNKIAARWPQSLTKLFAHHSDGNITLKNCKLFLSLVNRHRILAGILIDEEPGHFAQLFSYLDGSLTAKKPDEIKAFIEQRAPSLLSSLLASLRLIAIGSPAESPQPSADAAYNL